MRNDGVRGSRFNEKRAERNHTESAKNATADGVGFVVVTLVPVSGGKLDRGTLWLSDSLACTSVLDNDLRALSGYGLGRILGKPKRKAFG